MQRSTHIGLFTRALAGVGAAAAVVGASLLALPGIAGADGVADLGLGSVAPQPAASDGGMEGACVLIGAGGLYGSLFGFGGNPPAGACDDPGLLGGGSAADLFGSATPQPAAGDGGMVACPPDDSVPTISEILFGDGKDPNSPCRTVGWLEAGSLGSSSK